MVPEDSRMKKIARVLRNQVIRLYSGARCDKRDTRISRNVCEYRKRCPRYLISILYLHHSRLSRTGVSAGREPRRRLRGGIQQRRLSHGRKLQSNPGTGGERRQLQRSRGTELYGSNFGEHHGGETR